MIIRYCFVRLQPAHSSAEGRAAALAELDRLRRQEAVELRAAVGADDSAASWDLAIEIHAASLEALAAIMATRTWWEVFDGHLAARAAIVKAWNFRAALQ